MFVMLVWQRIARRGATKPCIVNLLSLRAFPDDGMANGHRMQRNPAGRELC